MFSLDFTIPASLVASFVVVLGLPLCLALVARLPFAAGRNALQFLVSVIIILVVWASVLSLIPPAQPKNTAEIVLGAMVLGAAIVFFLEIWALLCRGYTLGLVITIYRSGRPLSAAELARRYRSGEGLEWIMRHRLAGLEAAGLVYRAGDDLILSRRRGWAVAWICRAAIAVLGLKATG